VSKYLNRGGEIWEKREDGSERELFAVDVIKRLVDLEARLSEFTGADQSKSDWCPCCKQGWDCAEEDQKHRKEFTDLELEKYTADSGDDSLYNVRRLRKELGNALADRERFRYAIDQTAFYFAGTSSHHITEILTRVLNGESVQDIRKSP
jgi:hypothetical protein